jgi:hypothetical protein
MPLIPTFLLTFYYFFLEHQYSVDSGFSDSDSLELLFLTAARISAAFCKMSCKVNALGSTSGAGSGGSG